MVNNVEFKKIQRIKKKIESIKKVLIEFSKNEDPIVRLETLQALGLFYDGDVDKTILKGLKDKDELVRINALDNIILPKNPNKVFKEIAKLLKDKKILVRAYAVDALAYNDAIKYQKKIEKLLKTCTNNELKVSIYYALIKFGEKKYLRKLLKMLKHKNYRVRCSVANILYDIVDSQNHQLIMKKLNKALKHEKTKSVISCITRTVNDLNV